MRVFEGQSGQAAVETAIVMPLNVFLLLGIIQFGLISQARYMAKYAAYRAARVGAMNHGDVGKMTAAAEAALLPVVAMPTGTSGVEVIQPSASATDIGVKAAKLLALNTASGLVSGLKMIDVKICGPVRQHGTWNATNVTEQRLNGVGSANQIDFDDPRATLDMPAGFSPDTQLESFLGTKLRVQVQFNYLMPIPFANWVISRAYLGMALPSVLRMGGDGSPLAGLGSKLALASEAKLYIAPIFESYAMRMQSSLYVQNLPTSDECVTWAHGNPNK